MKERTMNDFQMSSLASARSANLYDEAYRQRLARSGKPSQGQPTASKAPRTPRFSLTSLLRRATA
jgi:hypothetical protein